jgi:hypothetical protein
MHEGINGSSFAVKNMKFGEGRNSMGDLLCPPEKSDLYVPRSLQSRKSHMIETLKDERQQEEMSNERISKHMNKFIP